MRVHTHEKLMACPDCGGMFANRTKLMDHLSRQNPEGCKFISSINLKNTTHLKFTQINRNFWSLPRHNVHYCFYNVHCFIWIHSFIYSYFSEFFITCRFFFNFFFRWELPVFALLEEVCIRTFVKRSHAPSRYVEYFASICQKWNEYLHSFVGLYTLYFSIITVN